MKILNLLVSGRLGGVERLCFDVARLSTDDNYFYFMWSGGIVAEKIKKISKNVVIRQFKYKNLVAEYIYLKKYIYDNLINVVLIQIPSPVFLIYLKQIKKCIPDIKICVYIHSDPADIFQSEWKRYQFAKFLKIVDGCIAISEFVADEMRKMFLYSDIKVIYNGTDIERFTKEKTSGEVCKASSVIQLLFVGRLIPQKGVDLLLQNLQYIDSEYFLTIVGDGPCKENLELLANELKLTSTVCFAGEHNDVEKWFQNADLFIHPAIWKEGFGITIIEAMAAGVPCVAYSRGGIPEIIDDGINGFLVDEFSETAYMEKLQEVIRLWSFDKEKFFCIVQNAKKRAKDFTINKYVKELSDFICNL